MDDKPEWRNPTEFQGIPIFYDFAIPKGFVFMDRENAVVKINPMSVDLLKEVLEQYNKTERTDG